MSVTKDLGYSPLRTLEEEEPEDLELGPVRKVRYKPRGNRYQDLFIQYDLETSPGGGERTFRNNGIWRGKDGGARKGIWLGVTMAIILVVLIVTAAVYVSPGPSTGSQDNALGFGDHLATIKPGLTLEDVLSGRFYSRGFNGTWISDNEIKYFDEKLNLYLYNIKTKTKRMILSGQDLQTFLDGKPPIKCTISADRNFVLISYDAQKVFRHSTFSKYGIFEVKTRKFHTLQPGPVEPTQKLLQLAEWGPVNNSLVFVYINNVFYKGGALDQYSHQLTDDGSQLVYNGITDWVYEEEVFGSDSAIWWSPDGSHLAFVTFNDTLVDVIQFEIYGEPGPMVHVYPIIESISYPKAGSPNPTARVTMVQLPGPGLKTLPVQKGLTYRDIPIEHYIYGVVWASPTEVLVITMNRHQNDSRHHLCTLAGAECDTVLVKKQVKGWIDIELPQVSSDGRTFLTLTSQLQGDGKRYRHILKYSKNSSTPITSGEFAVDNILKWDEKKGRIYFVAPHFHAHAHKSHPSSLHLFYIDDSGTNSSSMSCVTCHSTNSHKETCDYNSVDMSVKSSFYTQTCNGPNVPEVMIKSLEEPDHEPVFWTVNSVLRAKTTEYSWPTVQNFEIPIENGLTIQARIHLPPNLDPTKKYPMLVDVYGGPGSQKVTDKFLVDWSDSLITSKGVIYAYIDGRGSGRQSDDLKFQLYRRLGTVEIEDQIHGAEWLQTNVPFIDAKRTAIWGWSYGGYATAMVMGTDTKGVFQCGISVAPVTNWRFYDTIYTERYMGLPTPDDNLAAYNSSDVTNHIENFRHKKYFLVHGTADDNVHYQQSMVLARALEKADILFRQMSYPDENHALASIRKHLYHSLEDFLFTQCF